MRYANFRHEDAFGHRMRLDAFTRSLPAHSREALAAYLSNRAPQHALPFRSVDGKYVQPSWVYFPFWILETGDPGGVPDTGNVAVARDLAWAQLCLFYVFRIQDDLYDGDSAQPELIFVANMFLDEASGVFLRYIDAGHPFWRRYRTALRGSCDAMIVQRGIEAREEASMATHARTIRRLNAVLFVGAHAAASLAAEAPEYSSIEDFGAAMGLAGQLLDDLADLKEDARGGRINLAARIIAHRSTRESGPRPGDASNGNDLTPVATKILYSYRKAEKIALNFRFSGPLEHARQCRSWIDQTLRTQGPAGLVSRNPGMVTPWPA